MRYLDLIEPHRRGLHRFCCRMTRDVWDAEDLVQETLLRAFGRLGSAYEEIRNPRSYLLRAATNLWIDTLRRRATEAESHGLGDVSRASFPEGAAATRDAGAALFQKLAPQERAAVVLKDAFDLPLSEIAAILDTTVGAVKSALHRGRARLHEPEPEAPHRRAPASRELVDRFVSAFNARDLAALTERLLENASAEVLGFGAAQGRDMLASRNGWLQKALYGHEPWALDRREPVRAQRAESVLYRGEPIVALWRGDATGEAVEEIWRLEEEDGRVAGIRDYCFCPETLAEVAGELGWPLRTGGYRLPDQAIAWDREQREKDESRP